MLLKRNRVLKKEVDLIFKACPPTGREGRFITSPNLTFKFIKKNDSTYPRASFIAPKSIAKLAVKRNLLRRHGYDALKKYLHLFPAGLLGVFMFKKYQEDILTLENEIKNILTKIN